MIMPVLPSNHFRKQLVESVLVRRCRRNSSTTLTSDRVNFINEDQAGRCPLLNKSAHSAHRNTTNPEMEMKIPASPAIALASKVLPVPGANEQNAFGMRAPIAVKRSGCLRKVTTSCSSSCFVDASNVVKGDSGFGFHLEAGADLPKFAWLLLERNNSIKAINGKIHNSLLKSPMAAFSKKTVPLTRLC